MEVQFFTKTISKWIEECYEKGEMAGVPLTGTDNARVPRAAARADYDRWRTNNGITMPCTKELFSRAMNDVPGDFYAGSIRRHTAEGREWCFLLRPRSAQL